MALDQLRISKAEKVAENNSKAEKVKRRLARRKLEDEYEDEEESVPTFAAGLD